MPRQDLAAALAVVVGFAGGSARADVRLPAIFGDHMVVQEGRAIPFWGTADPGEKVTVRAAGVTGETVADGTGRWKLEIGPVVARDPFIVTVTGRNTIQLSNVVTGEVWIASGQSNMEWPLVGAADGSDEAERAWHPNLRLFQVERPRTLLEKQAPDVNGRWAPCAPNSVARFSAIGYYFGRELLEKLQRPIGIIHSSWGGTPAESWTRRSALAKQRALRGLLLEKPKDFPAAVRAFEEARDAWNKENARVDPGNKGLELGYAAPTFSPVGWQPITLPGFWEDEGLDVDGAVWLRKEITVPAAWIGQALTLRLGATRDCDTAYVNGERVGSTCGETPRHDLWPRRYPVPAVIVKPGRMTIAIRLFDHRDKGGLGGKKTSMRLVLGDKHDGPSLPLAGEWLFKVEAALPPLTVRPEGPPNPPPGMTHAKAAGVLWDNMVAPLVPFAIRGAIWYQGEANVKRAHQYRTLFPTMIRDWRQAWGQGDFPFLFVQLANHHPRWPGAGQRSEDEWAELREAQLLSLRLPQTGMAVTIDIGDRDDIHPTNKKEVGRRLSLVALAKVLGQDLPYSGPVYASHQVEKGRVRIRFTHAAGMTASGPLGERLMGFEVAGRDRRFVAADARIDGDAVVLSAPTVPSPVAVRYCWSDDPLCNLVNQAGLPASPFRTDRWPGLTVNRD